MTDKIVYGIFAGPDGESIARSIRAKDAEAVRIPRLFLASAEYGEKDLQLISDLDSFDWIVFREPAAVGFFMEALEAAGRDASAVEDLNVCAVTREVEAVLRTYRVHTDAVPFGRTSNDIAAAIESYAATGISELRILTAAGSPKLLRTALEYGSASTLQVYRLGFPDDLAKTRALLVGGLDALVIISETDLFELSVYFDALELRQALADVKVFASEAAMPIVREFGINARPLEVLQEAR